MSLRIWVCAAFHPAHRCGGWASVRLDRRVVTGAAGGERNTTAGRMALAGLAAGLRDLPPGADPAVSVITASRDLAAFADRLAHLDAPGGDGPSEDLDLWAQIVAASKGRRLSLTLAPVDPRAPTGFAAAWADLARDKAKASGPFASPIPRSNLAKVPGLPEA